MRQNNCAYKTHNNFKHASISVATHNTVGMSLVQTMFQLKMQSCASRQLHTYALFVSLGFNYIYLFRMIDVATQNAFLCHQKGFKMYASAIICQQFRVVVVPATPLLQLKMFLFLPGYLAIYLN